MLGDILIGITFLLLLAFYFGLIVILAKSIGGKIKEKLDG